jgi:hypothetical protein
VTARSETEQRILLAVEALSKAIDKAMGGDRPGRIEVHLFLRIGIYPLPIEREAGLASGAFAEIKVYRRVRLRERTKNSGCFVREKRRPD